MQDLFEKKKKFLNRMWKLISSERRLKIYPL